VALSVVYLFEVAVVDYVVDTGLERNYLVVAGHNDDDAELKALGEMHRADGDMAGACVDVVIKYAER
jgi:hypothetical protein